jgi:hypothetical protein
VKAIYGEPIAAHGKTVIPVAKIMSATERGRALEVWALAVLGAKGYPTCTQWLHRLWLLLRLRLW